jgi:hypothetical protein
MYHLIHSPAAGMLSSVTDLAAFDIALDQGRWPPSTSALYLKLPEMKLTFIVLANTDNLTVPFNVLGNGDVSKSLLTLSFFRHFIFPEPYGSEPPVIDWQESESLLTARLRAVEDEPSRDFLERKLWSYRQAYASTGRQDLVDLLERVNRKAFPISSFRRDQLFTATTGRFPVVSPIPSAASMVWSARVALVWLLLVVSSMTVTAIRLTRVKADGFKGFFAWLLAALLFGPLVLLIHRLVNPRESGSSLVNWREATGASCFRIGGYALAWVIVIILLHRLGDDAHPLLVLVVPYFIPLLVGLLLMRAPFLLRQGAGRLRSAISRRLLVEAISMNIGFAVLFPLTMFAQERVFSTLPLPTNPYFGVTLSVMAIAGLTALLPVQLVMGRRWHTVWPGMGTDSTDVWVLPALRDSWWLLLITLGIMIASLAWAIVQFG